MQKAVKLAQESGLQAKDVSDKELEKLQRLRMKATERDANQSEKGEGLGVAKLSDVISAENVQ